MFESHSLLWHFLWAAPNVLVLVVAAIFYCRSLHHQLPVFLVFAVVQGSTGLALYIADLMPSVSGALWWKMTWVRLMIEVIVKFVLIGELFFGVFQSYPSISKLGRTMIRGVGAALVLAATLLSTLPRPETVPGLLWGGRLLELADFITECGLLVFIFWFAAYFRLDWARLPFGIALGLGITASVELGTWAFLASLPLSLQLRNRVNLLNMIAYNVTVLIWLYYVLITPKWIRKDPSHGDKGVPRLDDSSDEDERQRTLDVWNRELERLLKR